MTNPNVFDPFALWRDMLSKWETGANEAANRNMASPEFSRVMNQTMGLSVRMRQGVGDAMARYLETMNMPTRADVVALGERLRGIEEQLSRLSDAVDRLAAGSSAAPLPIAGPPRTRQPKESNGASERAAPLRAEPATSRAARAGKPKRAARRAGRKKS